MQGKDYICHVYLGSRKLPSITAVAPTPTIALTSAIRGVQKIPNRKRKGLRIGLTERVYEIVSGGHSKAHDAPRDLSYIHTLA